jgi:hypothetical protein
VSFKKVKKHVVKQYNSKGRRESKNKIKQGKQKSLGKKIRA